MVLYNFFTNSQTNAGAFILAAAMQALKNGKDLSGILFFKANAIILKLQLQVFVLLFVICKCVSSCGSKNWWLMVISGCMLVAHKFKRVAQQVLKQLPEL